MMRDLKSNFLQEFKRFDAQEKKKLRNLQSTVI